MTWLDFMPIVWGACAALALALVLDAARIRRRASRNLVLRETLSELRARLEREREDA